MNTTNQTDLQTNGVVVVSPVLLVILIILAVAIVITNIISLIVMAFSRKLRGNNHHVLVLFLGFSDIMVGVSLVTILFAVMYESDLDTKEGCTFAFSFLLSSMAASFLQMFLLCIERFIAIKFPYYLERTFGGKKKYFYLAMLWILSTIFITIFVVAFSKPEVKECGIRGIFDEHYQRQILIIITGFFFIIYLTTVILYLYTICIIRQVTRRIYNSTNDKKTNSSDTQSKNPYSEEQNVSRNIMSGILRGSQGGSDANQNSRALNALQTDNSNTSQRESNSQMTRGECQRATESRKKRVLRGQSNYRFKLEKKATVTVGCILSVLTLCVLPVTVVEALGQLNVFVVSGNLRTIVGCILALNSLFNPLLFSVRIEEFRREFRKLLPCS